MGRWVQTVLVPALIAAVSAMAAPAHAQTGFALQGSRIVVNRPSHWRAWRYQNDLVTGRSASVDSVAFFKIGPRGVSARYISDLANYVLDRADFAYVDVVGDRGEIVGNVDGRSNPALAALIGDGDPTTFWEPAVEDFSARGLRNWRLDVDLGRVVWADSIVVVFSPPELGDPLLQFGVEAASGAISGRGVLSYATVGQQTVVDTTRRRYSFPLLTEETDFDADGNPDFGGRFLQHVRLSAFASDFDRKRLLGTGEAGRQAYEALASERRGLKVHHRLAGGGRASRVDSSVYYGLLAPEERGPIHYYLRELPRVAEIEVWGRGPNVAYRVERQTGGSFEDGRAEIGSVTDGSYATSWDANSWDLRFSSNYAGHVQSVCCTGWIDLGAPMWITRILVGSSDVSGYRVKGYSLFGSDGTVVRPVSIEDTNDYAQLELGLRWADLVSEEHWDNRTARALVLSEEVAERKLRFFQFRNINPAGRAKGSYSEYGQIAEFQVYARGYPAELSLTSRPMILVAGVKPEDAATVNERRGLALISWDAVALLQRGGEEVVDSLAAHPELDLLIRTRTSDTIDSAFTYYEVTGVGTKNERITEVGEADYLSLLEAWSLHDRWNSMPDTRTINLQPHSTGRDDDGDGRTDEDGTDGVDNDGDGLIDEDGRTGEEGGPNGRGTITLFKHKRKRDDDGDGVEDEDPIDGVDNDGDGLIDEDGKKVAAPRQEPRVTVAPVFADWSAWSPPYRAEGGRATALITSPSPRKFLQIRASVLSGDPEATIGLRALRIELSPPVSAELAGELAAVTALGEARVPGDPVAEAADYRPPVDISPVAEQLYSFFLRAAGPDPVAAAASPGFDQVLLRGPFPLRLRSVRLGTARVREAEGPGGTRQTLASASVFQEAYVRSGGDSVLVAGAGRRLTMATTSPDSLLLTFQDLVNADLEDGEHALIEVQFHSLTPRAGAEFEAFVRYSGSESSTYQRVGIRGQDATELVDSGTAVPTILVSGHALLEDLDISPVISPNGDGVNDVARIGFTILHLLDRRPVHVRIYDLSGQWVGEPEPVEEGTGSPSGRLTFTWDGRDRGGRVVRSGIYLCRVEVEADAGTVARMGVLHVAY